MTNVVDIGCITTLDSDPNRMLEKAKDADLKGVIIIGYKKDGDEYFCSSYADGGVVNWLLDRIKHKLIKLPDEDF